MVYLVQDQNHISFQFDYEQEDRNLFFNMVDRIDMIVGVNQYHISYLVNEMETLDQQVDQPLYID